MYGGKEREKACQFWVVKCRREIALSNLLSLSYFPFSWFNNNLSLLPISTRSYHRGIRASLGPDGT